MIRSRSLGLFFLQCLELATHQFFENRAGPDRHVDHWNELPQLGKVDQYALGIDNPFGLPFRW